MNMFRRRRRWARGALSYAQPPSQGDSLIILKQPYAGLVMTGQKTMELRCHAIVRDCYLADSTSHEVLAFVRFGAWRELDEEDYHACFEQHRYASPTKPYRRTVGTQIVGVQPLEVPVTYQPRRGAIGYARFYSG